jgi:hypothetical protein
MGHISKSGKRRRLGKNLQPSEAADAPNALGFLSHRFFRVFFRKELRGLIARGTWAKSRV